MGFPAPRKIPTYPGVYVFRRGQVPLYVGKAANIKSRLASYFQGGRERQPPKIQKMLEEATSLRFIRTASEIEALIREAELIKKWRPKYNVLMRDDKNYFYVAITKERYPRLRVTHQPYKERLGASGKGRGDSGSNVLSANRYPLAPRYIGPFTGGSELYTTLKLMRRVFPYCTCSRPHARPCLASQIGRCLGVCCLLPGSHELKRMGGARVRRLSRRYARNIAYIVAVLQGKKSRLANALARNMKSAVRREHYEEAALLRDELSGLQGIFAHQHVLHAPAERYPWGLVESSLQKLLKIERTIRRIEGYDISNISGTEATGSMVVFDNGIANKSQYRKFRIKTVAGANDVAMHQEVIRRRLNHPEWPRPDIIVIDGGKPQLNAVMNVIRESRITNHESRNILVTALAKREEILFRENGPAIPLKRQEPAVFHLFQRIRDESHRFARAYHHELRKRRYKNDLE